MSALEGMKLSDPAWIGCGKACFDADSDVEERTLVKLAAQEAGEREEGVKEQRLVVVRWRGERLADRAQQGRLQRGVGQGFKLELLKAFHPARLCAVRSGVAQRACGHPSAGLMWGDVVFKQGEDGDERGLKWSDDGVSPLCVCPRASSKARRRVCLVSLS